jgi:hypothetical protein
MRRSHIIELGVYAAAIIAMILGVAFATPTSGAATTARAAEPPAPIGTVQRISYAREAKTEHGTPYRLIRVRCAQTAHAYMYVCNFEGEIVATRKPVCAATFVHYNPNLSADKVNFWSFAWRCGTLPPAVPAPYPGDGPKS